MPLEWTTDLIIFAAIAGVSATLLVVSVLLGEVFEIGDAIFGDGEGPIFIDSGTFFAFFTVFGATGWIASGQFDMAALPATGVAVAGGLVIGIPVGFMLRFFKKNAGATNYSLEETVGITGVVVLAIPEGSNGRVEVVLPGRGNQSMLARSTDGRPVQEGRLVNIDRVVSSIAYVSETGGKQS
jgi:hypothetical protein